jgi:hypothetical protein
MATMVEGAMAQPWPRDEAPETLSVYEVSRPDYTAPGISVGSFLVTPKLQETVTLDDNIFATTEQPDFDLVNTSGQSIAWHSQWSRHGWAGRAFADQEIFKNHERENANSFGAETTGRLDITRDAYVQFDGGFARQPQNRASIQADAGKGDRPIYDTSLVSATLAARFNQVTERLQGDMRRIDYVTAGNESREGRHESLHNRLSFDFSDRFGLFFDTEHAAHRWDDRSDLRNSTVLSALVGIRAEEPTLIRGEIGVGLSHQTFKFDEFDALTTPVVRGNLLWNVRPLTSLQIAAARTVSGTEFFCGAAAGCETSRRDSLTTTAGEVALQHEFYHNLLGRTHFRYERDVFDRVGLVDDTYTAVAELNYLINRNVELSLHYTHRSRTANLPLDRTYNSGPFTENIFGLGLRATF